MTRRTWLALAPLAVALSPRRAAALSHEIVGNDPLVPGAHGYAADVLAVINQPARVYMVIGGRLNIPYCYYAGTPAAANAAAALFAKVTHPGRRIVLAAGPREAQTFDKKKVPYDFSFRTYTDLRGRADFAPVLQLQVTAAVPAAADVKPLAAALDSPRFAERDAATRELAKLGRAAKPGLLTARAATTSAEVRERIDALLGKLTGTDVLDLALPAGVPVVAEEGEEKAETRAIRDDIARVVAKRK